jgi:hypothetical protein
VAKDVVLTCLFCKNHTFFVFWHRIRSPNFMEREISLSTILLIRNFWGVWHRFFVLYINVASCERCLTVYVWSERASVWDFVVLLLFLLVVDSSSFLLSFYWLLVGVVFREGFYY